MKVYQVYLDNNDQWEGHYEEIVGTYSSYEEALKHIKHKGYKEVVDFTLNSDLKRLSDDFQGIYDHYSKDYIMYIKSVEVSDKFDSKELVDFEGFYYSEE